MRRRRLIAAALLAAGAASVQAQTALKVLTAGAYKQVLLALLPAFQARSDTAVTVDNDTAGALLSRVRSGDAFDVIVAPPAALKMLADDGRIDAPVPVAKVAIGVAVKAGAPRPALDTVEQFKQALLAARKVAYIDPASGGSSGVYLDGLFQRLGIADAVRAKAVLVPGGLVAERVASGEADLAIHQVSEILPVTGVELAGLLPDAIQNHTTYAAAVSTGSRAPAAARALVAALAAPEAAAAIRAKGMQPAR